MPARRRTPEPAPAAEPVDPVEELAPPPVELPSDGWVVATDRLYVGAALAHLPGDLVPAHNVEPNGWAGKVAPLPAPPPTPEPVVDEPEAPAEA